MGQWRAHPKSSPRMLLLWCVMRMIDLTKMVLNLSNKGHKVFTPVLPYSHIKNITTQHCTKCISSPLHINCKDTHEYIYYLNYFGCEPYAASIVEGRAVRLRLHQHPGARSPGACSERPGLLLASPWVAICRSPPDVKHYRSWKNTLHIQ